MGFRVVALILFVCISWSNGEEHTLPSYIKPCNRTDPNIHKCVEENIEILKPHLKEGIPDLFIPSLDPLLIPPTCVNEEDQVKVIFTDIHIFHADKFQLDQFDLDLDLHKVNLSITFPHLRIKSTYNVNGKFWIVTFDEQGPADGNYTNCQVHLGLKGTPFTKNHKEYLRWEKETISLEVEDSHVVLEKLFGNHTDINDKTNKVINENIEVIINDLQPVIQRVVTKFIQVCKRNDPNLEQCVIKNVEILRPMMKRGIPELFVPSMNPLEIPEASLSGSQSFQASFKNIQLYGADQFKLESFETDFKTYHIKVKLSFPSLRIKSLYNIKGRILILNLDGHGPADGNYTNVRTSLSLKGEQFQKNNKEYVKWHKEDIDISIGKINLYFEQIFGSNEELNDQTNRVINENIDQLIEELQPVIQKIVSEFVFSLINRLFAKYSMDELFPLS
ncbi:hypothetical protein HUJ05_003864 [Dendroctonus ponderosae]|nr:hypothetical protein HUJ05_003864 [Dendroctonus ponderosae]